MSSGDNKTHIMGNEIILALSNIMKSGVVDKTRIACKYNVHLIDDVLFTLSRSFCENNLIPHITYDICIDNFINIDKKNKKYFLVKCNLVLYHSSGQCTPIYTSFGEGIDSMDKAMSKAQTYAFKKVLLQLFMISDGVDGDKKVSPDVNIYNTSYLLNREEVDKTIHDISSVEELKKYCSEEKKKSLKEEDFKFLLDRFNKKMKIFTADKDDKDVKEAVVSDK